MTFQIAQLFGLAFTLVVASGAIWRGGPPERLAGWTMMAAAIVNMFLADRAWDGVQVAILTIDVAMTVFLVVLALWADRWWPLWAAGFQLFALGIHLAFAVQHKVMSLTYVTALNIMGYLVFAALGLGVIAHIRRQKRARAG